MIRRTTLLLALAAALPAGASPGDLWAVYLDACGQAVTDPEAFYERVPALAEGGAYRIERVTETEIVEVHVALPAYRLRHEAGRVGEASWQTCSVSTNDVTGDFEAYVGDFIEAAGQHGDIVGGGSHPMHELMFLDGSFQEYVSERNHQFYVLNVLPGVAGISFAQILEGYASIGHYGGMAEGAVVPTALPEPTGTVQ